MTNTNELNDNLKVLLEGKEKAEELWKLWMIVDGTDDLTLEIALALIHDGIITDDIEDAIQEAEDNVITYFGVGDMEDVARELVDTGHFGHVDTQLEDYIDFMTLGDNLESEGNYIVLGDQVIIEYVG